MTPLPFAHSELALVVAQLEQRAGVMRATPARRSDDALRWEDQRTWALSLVSEALDRIEPQLGVRFLHALYAEGVDGLPHPVALPLPPAFPATGARP